MNKHIKFLESNSKFIDKIVRDEYTSMLYSDDFRDLSYSIDAEFCKSSSFSPSDMARFHTVLYNCFVDFVSDCSDDRTVILSSSVMDSLIDDYIIHETHYFIEFIKYHLK